MESDLNHPADRLLAAIERKGSATCVGLDPVYEKLPAPLRQGDASLHDEIAAIARFCEGVIEAVSPHVAAIKFQSACFERYSFLGVQLLCEMMKSAHGAGLEIILDAKRGDIGVSADHYAASAFDPRLPVSADWITINSYLGEDGITPFLKFPAHGAFALVRTSNPGGDALQRLELKDGRNVSDAVAMNIASIGSSFVGNRGYSALGAVVGATKKEDAAWLRQLMPQQLFLVPGYGAQGGGAADVLPCFKSDGAGAIITASRSVIYAFSANDEQWWESVGTAAQEFARDIASVLRR